MKKTYITVLPNHFGAFLKANRCFEKLGINITRVSYNKAIDSHTLFIDAEGSKEQLEKADIELKKIGYLENRKKDPSVVLLEFLPENKPGGGTKILELISKFNFNISYISASPCSGDRQSFKLGLFITDRKQLNSFLELAKDICPVRLLDYDSARKNYDNSIFYQSFVKGLSSNIKLSAETESELAVNANLAMQTLDEQGLSPYKTFDVIGKIAEMLGSFTGDRFNPRISRMSLTEQTELVLIEPPCGSNTAILINGGKALFIDCGFAVYKDEMIKIFKSIFENYDSMEKTLFITHSDIDHCGLINEFDKVIASARSKQSLALEYQGKDNFREQNVFHKPYIKICKALTGYIPCPPEKVETPFASPEKLTEPLTSVGFFDFCDLHFEVYEGAGGHIVGETVLIDYGHHIAFTGDIFVNIKGFTKEQAQFNGLAPILMTSVDTEKDLCRKEREALIGRLGVGMWRVFGAHGACRNFNVCCEK